MKYKNWIKSIYIAINYENLILSLIKDPKWGKMSQNSKSHMKNVNENVAEIREDTNEMQMEN